jgi:CRISPR/Cas system-associated exonuclease Cas4 (RecB family)
MAIPRLSKSKFLAGLQCPKRVYLEVHHPDWAAPPDPSMQAVLDMGTELGVLARSRFPGGVLIEEGYRQREAALARTAMVVADPAVPAMFEGAFEHDGVVIRADVLERTATGTVGEARTWRLIEVKSSSRVKDVHLADLAIQSDVLQGCGIVLSAMCLMHINTDYIYEGGGIDIGRLFAIEDVTDAVMSRRVKVPEQVAEMKTLLLQNTPPVVEPGPHCHAPYECPFWNHCTKEKPARWIYYLPGSKQVVTGLAGRGVTTIDEIPAGTTLSLSQRRVKDNVEWVSEKLGAALQSIRYPVHHVDFETVMLAAPRYPSTRPYQSIPVQWSNHIEDKSGTVTHQEFLHVEPSEPRKQWAEALIESLGEHGSICVYSAYEEAMIRQLADAFPEFRSAFNPILKRLWDLHPIVKDHYYHPAFKGSYSMKSVLPAVVPSLAYDDLRIREGGQAAAEYYRMVFVETDWIERAAIREALLRYCERDTLALVELRRVLREKAGG